MGSTLRLLSSNPRLIIKVLKIGDRGIKSYLVPLKPDHYVTFNYQTRESSSARYESASLSVIPPDWILVEDDLDELTILMYSDSDTVVVAPTAMISRRANLVLYDRAILPSRESREDSSWDCTVINQHLADIAKVHHQFQTSLDSLDRMVKSIPK